MNVGEFKTWLIENKVPDHADIVLAPVGVDYLAFEPEYDDDKGIGEAVLIPFYLESR